MNRFADHLLGRLFAWDRHDDRLDARLAVLRTQIAVKRWFLRHGSYPRTLNDLVPSLLPELPVDQLSDDDEPLRYVHNHGEVRIYSLGKNLVDDGGTQEVGNNDEADIVATLPEM